MTIERVTRYEVRVAGCGLRGAGCEVRVSGPGCSILDTGYTKKRTEKQECGMRNAEVEKWRVAIKKL